MALSCEKVSARLQPATAGHARLVLSKTVPFFCTSLYLGAMATVMAVSSSYDRWTLPGLSIEVEGLALGPHIYKWRNPIQRQRKPSANHLRFSVRVQRFKVLLIHGMALVSSAALCFSVVQCTNQCLGEAADRCAHFTDKKLAAWTTTGISPPPSPPLPSPPTMSARPAARPARTNGELNREWRRVSPRVRAALARPQYSIESAVASVPPSLPLSLLAWEDATLPEWRVSPPARSLPEYTPERPTDSHRKERRNRERQRKPGREQRGGRHSPLRQAQRAIERTSARWR